MPSRGCVALLIGALLAPPARAATPKDVPLGHKQSSSVGPDASLAGDVRRKKVKAEVAPALEYDAFRFQLELQVSGKRDAQMETLRKIIDLGASDRDMPDLLFRYAELEWEQSRYFFFESNRRDDDYTRAKEKGDEAAMQLAHQQKDAQLKQSQAYQADAIARYRTIVRKYPTYPRMDEVLYFLGHNLWDEGKEHDALGIYKLLVTKFPNSKYLPDAYLAFGEYYFENSHGQRPELLKAQAAYKKASSYPENKVYLYALYKQGWCFYNLADYPGAMDMFKTVVLTADVASPVAQGSKLRLAKDARRDYVLAYSHYGSPLAAKEDFLKVGGVDNWWPMLKGLADLYYDDGNDKAAVLVYRQLIKERPLSPEAPFFQGRIVDAAMRVGNKRITVQQARILVQILQQVEQSGAAKSDADKKIVAAARDLAERTLSNLAVTWHNEGKKTRDEETFAMANEVYADYLTIFPSSPKAYDLRFYHGELLFDNLQDYRQAAQEYARVVADDVKLVDAGKKPGRWFQKAAEDSVFSWEQVVKTPDAQLSRIGTGGEHPLPIPPDEQGLLTACETYAKYFPHGDKAVEVHYKAAQIYYRANRFDDAIRLFGVIATQHPDSSLAIYSANLILDSYNLQGRYQDVHDWAKRFLANPKLAKGKFREDLLRIIEESGFKIVESLERQGQYELAATKYLAFVAEFPRGNRADQALWNASVDLYKAHQIARAVEVRGRLVAEYPKSPLMPKALFANAQAAEGYADFATAATLYERYAADYQKQVGGPKPKAGKRGRGKATTPPPAAANDEPPETGPVFEASQAQEALINAAIYRVGLKQYAEALHDRDLYLELWPPAKHGDPNSASEQVFASVADVDEDMGRFAAAIEQLDEHSRHVERDPSAYLVAQLRVAKLYEKAKNPKMARKIYEQMLQLYHHTRRKLTPAAMEAVGRSSYLLNQDTYDAFDRIKLRLPEAELLKSAKAKGRALLEVQRVYTETVALGSGAPAICALWRIGLAYQSFAQSLTEAPVPPQFQSDPRLLQAYKEELAKQAAPVEVKAKELYQSAMAKSRELGIYNDCAVRSLEGLVRADPKDFAESVVAPVPVEISAAALVLAPAHPLKEVWQNDTAAVTKKPSAGNGAAPAPSAPATPPAAAAAPPPPAAPPSTPPPSDSEELSPPPEPAKEHTAPAPAETPAETPAPAAPAQPQEPEPSF